MFVILSGHNRGGSTSVLVVDKSHNNNKILKNFGCFSDDIELEKRIAHSNDYITQKIWQEQHSFPEQEDETILQFTSTISNSQIQVNQSNTTSNSSKVSLRFALSAVSSEKPNRGE